MEWKAVVVTGANKGIGLAITQSILLEHEDTYVFMCCRNPDLGEMARQTLTHSNRAEVVLLDVSSEKSVESAERILKENLEAKGIKYLFGIVNNAGVGSWDGSISFEDMLQVNVYGIMRVYLHLSKYLHPQRGRIVNVTSAAGPMFLEKASEELKTKLVSRQIQWNEIEEIMTKALQERKIPVDSQYGFR